MAVFLPKTWHPAQNDQNGLQLGCESRPVFFSLNLPVASWSSSRLRRLKNTTRLLLTRHSLSLPISRCDRFWSQNVSKIPKPPGLSCELPRRNLWDSHVIFCRYMHLEHPNFRWLTLHLVVNTSKIIMATTKYNLGFKHLSLYLYINKYHIYIYIDIYIYIYRYIYIYTYLLPCVCPMMTHVFLYNLFISFQFLWL